MKPENIFQQDEAPVRIVRIVRRTWLQRVVRWPGVWFSAYRIIRRTSGRWQSFKFSFLFSRGLIKR